MKKEDEYTKKLSEITKKAEALGVKVKESKTGAIGFVGGVHKPDPDNIKAALKMGGERVTLNGVEAVRYWPKKK